MAEQLPTGNNGAGFAPSTARVLIIDPDVRFGLLLKGYLEGRGWKAEWVEDGRKALQHWETYRPDLLITELQGKDLDGFELLDALSRIGRPPPVVICTRMAGVSSWTDGVFRRLGVRAVLVRPVRFPEVAQTLEEVMAQITDTMAAIPAVAVP
ncbi:MAG: response regulator [Proteobacteria bacterium]|nr:response regulator [Pseudomonadota bacterium]